jgi:hypothetical protein
LALFQTMVGALEASTDHIVLVVFHVPEPPEGEFQ